MKRWVVGAMGWLAALCCAGQHAGFGDAIYPERLRADVDAVERAVAEAHPDLLRYLTSGELERVFQDLRDSLLTTTTTDRFAFLLTQALQRIGDGVIEVRLDNRTRTRMEAAHLLPLSFQVLPDGLYIGQELKGFRTFEPGSRVLSINGLGSERIIRDCGRWVLVDGANETRRLRRLEQDLPRYFLLTYGSMTRFVIEVEAPDGTRTTEVVNGLEADEIDRSLRPSGAALMPWRSTWDAETRTLWASLTTMDAEALRRSGQKPRRFVDAMLRELRRNEARNLVLDLRGCEGRELALAELVFAAIAREPFRVIQGMSARSGSWKEGDGLAEMPGPHLASIDRNYLPASNGLLQLRPDDPRLQPVSPMSGAFSGQVFVITDGGTRHAGALLAMMAGRTGRARLIGEETGSNAHAFTGGHELLITAPNSGVQVSIPLVRYLPDGAAKGPEDRGELPRHAVHQLPWALARGRDAVRISVIEMIRALQ